MSQSEIQRFIADLGASAALRTEAEKAGEAPSQARLLDAVVSFAASKGYGFSAEEMKMHLHAKAMAAGKKLSDTQLDGIAAGATGSGEASLIYDSITGSILTGSEFAESTGIVAPPWTPPSWKPDQG